jgi:hypothetical protein
MEALRTECGSPVLLLPFRDESTYHTGYILAMKRFCKSSMFTGSSGIMLCQTRRLRPPSCESESWTKRPFSSLSFDLCIGANQCSLQCFVSTNFRSRIFNIRYIHWYLVLVVVVVVVALFNVFKRLKAA